MPIEIVTTLSSEDYHKDKGIGKSRLIYEFIKQNDSDFAIGASSNISSKPYHIFSSFIKDSCNISIIDDKSVIKDKFEKTINNIIAINPLRADELKSTIPFLGLIIGVKYEDSRLSNKNDFINQGGLASTHGFFEIFLFNIEILFARSLPPTPQ